MSKLISEIGRKTPRARMLYAAIYAVLILGSVTMLYPFLLMISGSSRSSVDSREFSLVPEFINNDIWLYRKHIEGLFNESPNSLRICYDISAPGFRELEPPDNYNQFLAEEIVLWAEKREIPWYAVSSGYMDTPVSRTKPLNLRLLQKQLQRTYATIDELNDALQTEFTTWSSIKFKARQFLLRHEKPVRTRFTDVSESFRKDLPLALQYFASPEGLFKRVFLPGKYGGDHSGRRLHRRYPSAASDLDKSDWADFVRRVLAVQWLTADSSADQEYQRYLEAKYVSIDALNRYYGTGYKEFGGISVTHIDRFSRTAESDWSSFISAWRGPDGSIYQAPLEALSINSPATMFQDYAETKFRNIERFNRIFGTSYGSFADIALPQADMHYAWFLRNRSFIRREFCTRNYKAVWEYLVIHGHGIYNTAVYCILLVICALTVNPLAAYALSRFKLPSAYKILLFLLCTMAFPPMVTSIPSFLMLRKMGLLNTFAALVLPAMANGYAIFLLKGFFDSQPRELYESAQIDGAKEWTIFWQITMSLSRPILAVIALQAFMLAYSNFMFAFIVCQDEKMWTLMVWLYQLHHRSGQAVMYASLIIAAIPTFIIFLSCQRVIMRGIVVPSEK